MHFLLGAAALLALVAMAFGERAASVTAAIILLGGAALALAFVAIAVCGRGGMNACGF